MGFRLLPACILAAAGLSTAAPIAVSADESVVAAVAAPVSVYTGSAHVLAFGELVDCSEFAPVTQVLQTVLVYAAMPGVCDDLSQRPCGGRLIAEMERCLGGGNLPLASNTLAGGYSSSPLRICVQPPGNLSLSCADGAVVARGIWTGAGFAPATSAVLEGTASLGIRQARWFQFDGARVRVRQTPSIQHFSLEKSQPSPAGCGVSSAGCGVIGVGSY